MKPRHAAALALVGWYLMWPPERCVDKSRNDLGVCDMHYDATAALWEWQEGRRFPTAQACNAVIARERKLAADLGNQRKVAGAKCVTWKELHDAQRIRPVQTPVPDSDEPLHPRIAPSD